MNAETSSKILKVSNEKAAVFMTNAVVSLDVRDFQVCEGDAVLTFDDSFA